MQMGDCNAPSTFQRLMTAIFHDCIGRFVHVYMDDIFIFSCLIEEHKKHLGIIFDRLRKNHLFSVRKR
jgi:Reverse transcriptase (RNA-dependent DNA polymerase)